MRLGAASRDEPPSAEDALRRGTGAHTARNVSWKSRRALQMTSRAKAGARNAHDRGEKLTCRARSVLRESDPRVLLSQSSEIMAFPRTLPSQIVVEDQPAC